MKIFSINDLERFSGIKAHTIRVWERRYALMEPVRSPGNIRMYDLAHLKQMLHISLLQKNGYRISEISKFTSQALLEKIAKLTNNESRWEMAINELSIQRFTIGCPLFEKVLDELFVTWPVHTLVKKVLYPFLSNTKLLWIGNKISEEHLVVTAIRKKLIFAIETTLLKPFKKNTVLLFLPDSRQLDLGLLYANYILKQKGIKIIYLGNDVSIDNLKNILAIYNPSHLFTYLQAHHNFNFKSLLENMSIILPQAKLVIGKYTDEQPFLFVSDKMVQMDFLNALEYINTDSCKAV